MRLNRHPIFTAAAILGATGLVLSGCNADDSDSTEAKDSMSSTSSMTSSEDSPSSEAESETETDTEAAAAAEAPSGPLCQAYADAHPDGPASLEVIAGQNIVEALPNIPELSTLTAALTGELNPDVNLVSTIEGGQWTIFAPTNGAFEKLDPATIEELKTNSNMLTSILTYHAVEGQAGMDAIVGEHTTVGGSMLTVTDGEPMMVNDATVGCANVPTENARVYIIDTVLIPNK
ncbi:fasciclin domain-containing protein [Corynebacterium sp. TAE3-ERU30]|uniref:fasciclin domain-containing protein n=1 Tax=Corynebacterium sp. TAE3-ERU30 TaxID=2849496 RepID=UPI001C4369C4|nr:fasciclin domain-containing protein [Corynebacterium sp. TAE3-ERU30]MBV7282453.1 fasciclin domain-containing protein [Corynebacterium sp. TAE3-ERU30]